MTRTQKIIEAVRKDPKVSSALLAERFGVHQAYVRTALHRAGIFRGKHDPNVIYNTGRLVNILDSVACKAEAVAAQYEAEAQKHPRQLGTMYLTTDKNSHISMS